MRALEPITLLAITLATSPLSATPATSRPAAVSAPPLADSANVPFMAKLVARGFFRALLAGDLAALKPMCDARVDFDGARVKGPKAIEQRLRSIIARIKQKGLRLRRIVVLSGPAMRERFGPAPSRIKKSVNRHDVIALARFNRLGAIAVLKRRGRFWRVAALTD